MRISDWSSDVCSSDLLVAALDLAGGSRLTLTAAAARSGSGYAVTAEAAADAVPVNDLARLWPSVVGASAREWVTKIGRASCRARMCQSVSISVAAVSLTKTQSVGTRKNQEIRA